MVMRSVEQALSGGDVYELPRVWEDFNRGETWREVSAIGNDQARAAAAQFLAEVREAAALEALRANAKAVELITGRRWGSRNKRPMISTPARSKNRRSICRTFTTWQPRAQSWKKSRKTRSGQFFDPDPPYCFPGICGPCPW